jgi:hypothetical protein
MQAGADARLIASGTVEVAIKRGILTEHDARTASRDFYKPAGARCQHQRHGKGCAIYQRRPLGCRFWTCRWLAEDDTTDIRRPDRAHYVIDVSPDYVKEDGRVIPVVQIWLDPGFPDAHKDPALRAYIERRAEEHTAALIRLNATDAFMLAAPKLSGTGEWREIHARAHEHEHTVADKVEALGSYKVTFDARDDGHS